MTSKARCGAALERIPTGYALVNRAKMWKTWGNPSQVEAYQTIVANISHCV
jgi:hypothetical protein